MGKNPKRGKKSGADGEQPRLGHPPPIRSVAFSIYHDPPSPSTTMHTVYGNPIAYPYRNLPQGRIPLAPIDGSRKPLSNISEIPFLDPTVHSTPKQVTGNQASDIPGLPHRQKVWGNAAGRSQDKQLGNSFGQSVVDSKVFVDPFSMDDPGFPDRWRMPPGPVLQTMHRSHELGKMWKYADQIAVFEGSIQQYLRWAPTFYDMVHVQPMPWAYKISILAAKLSPKISSFVIGSLAFE